MNPDQIQQQLDLIQNRVTTIEQKTGSIQPNALLNQYSVDPQSASFLQDFIALPYDTTIPTFTPNKNGYERVVKTGSAYALYIYADGGWRSVGLSGSSSNGTTGINFFGDGSDGSVTISGSTTITRDMFYDTLIVNSGVTLNAGGFRVFGSTSITNYGTISRIGNNGTNGGLGGDAVGIASVASAGGSAGTAAIALVSGTIYGSVAGANGSQGNVVANAGYTASSGVNATNSVLSSSGTTGGNGGAGNGGSNQSNGASGGTTTQVSQLRQVEIAVNPSTGAGFLQGSASGGGGGGGGSGNHAASNMATASGGGGGGSGSPGGIVALFSPIIDNFGTFTVQGGNGGDGGAGGNASGAADGNEGGGGGGGGAPGNGGAIVCVYRDRLTTGTVVVSAGTIGHGGAAGTGSSGFSGGGNGNVGSDATAGSSGLFVQLKV